MTDFYTDGNISATGNITTTNSNLQAPQGSIYVQANVVAAGQIYADGNIYGNGTLLVASAEISGNLAVSSISTDTYNYANGDPIPLNGLTYTNANVAAFLPTYTGTIATTAIDLDNTLVTIGLNANAGIDGVAIGNNAANSGGGANSVIIGSGAGAVLSGANSVLIGAGAGATRAGVAGQNMVAIGSDAGAFNQGNNAVAIGYRAGYTDQSQQSIVINATGAELSSIFPGTYIAPVRRNDFNTDYALYYDAVSKEVTFTVPQGGGGATTYANSNVQSFLASGTLGDDIIPGNDNLYTLGNATQQWGNIYTGGNVVIKGQQLTVDTGAVLEYNNLPVILGDVNGNITAPYYFGNGSQLTGMYGNSNVAIYLPDYAGDLSSVGNVTASGNVTADYYNGNGSQLTGMYGDANVEAYLPSYSGNLDSVTSITAIANISTTNFTATGLVDLGSVNDLTITGGNLGEVLTTNGSGDLTWQTVDLNVVPAVYLTAPFDGNNQVFSNTILASYTSNTEMTVFYNGALLENTKYTLSGDTITVNIPLTVGDGIDVITTVASSVNSIVSSGYGNSNVAAYLPIYSGGIGNLSGNVTTTADVNSSNVYTSNVFLGTDKLILTQNRIATNANTITIDPLNDGLPGPGGKVVIAGDLQVTGNITYNDVVNATTNDLLWIAANNAADESSATGGGLGVGPDGNYATFTYNSGANAWQSSLQLISANGVAVGGALSNATTGGFSGNVTADHFLGNGSQLTGIALTAITNGTSNVSATSNGPVTMAVNGISAFTVGNTAVAVGAYAGTDTQGAGAVSIGYVAGQTTQGANAVAIGYSAGRDFQGINAVAIGTLAGAVNQAANSIVINASGSSLNGANSGLYVAPVRNDIGNTTNVVYYNTTSKEVTYGPGVAGYANSDVATYLASNANVVITTTGNITTTANVAAGYFIGNGSQLTGLPAGYANTDVANYLPTYTGNLSSVTNITASGNINANNFTATSNIATANLTATTANIGNLKATTANITGNLNVANLVATGTVAATNIGNITPINLSGTVTQWLAGNGTWQTPPGVESFRNITKVDQIYGYGNQFIIADGRLYIIKGNGGNNAWNSGLGDFSNGLNQGINNMYELPFLSESIGTIVDAGSYGPSSYALFANGNLYTWGYNGYGQLGLGSTTDQKFPVLSNTGVAQVYTDPSQAQSPNSFIQRLVIRKTNNTFFGCGHDGQGQLGLGTTTSKTSWTAMPWIPTDVLSVWNLGGDLGSMFIQLANGNIQATGWNGRGQLGVGNYTATYTTPVNSNGWLAGDSTMRIQSIGWGGPYNGGGGQENYCNITMFLDNGSVSIVRGAGDNNWGSLGTGNLTSTATVVAPITTTGFTGRVAKMLFVGPAPKSVYALMTNGDLYGWGYNAYGQIATGGTASQQSPFLITTNVLDIDGAVQGWDINGYSTMSPFIKKADGYYSSGYGTFGQLGNGTTDNSVTLQRLRVPSEITFKFFGCFASSNEGLTRIGITEQNTIWAWGYNSNNTIDATNTTTVIQPLEFYPMALDPGSAPPSVETVPAFSATGTGNTVISATFTATQVAYPTEVYDSNNWFASNRYTPQRAGWYQINGGARCLIAGGDGTVETSVGLRKNGTYIGIQGGYGSTIGTISRLVYFNGTTDYVDVVINSSQLGNVVQNAAQAFFNGFLVRV